MPAEKIAEAEHVHRPTVLLLRKFKKLFKTTEVYYTNGDRMNMTEIYGMDIYSDSGQYLGEVRDAIVDLEGGGISRLLMEEWRSTNAAEIRRILKEKSVLFKNIKNISDVVLVSASGQVRHAEASDSSEAADLSR